MNKFKQHDNSLSHLLKAWEVNIPESAYKNFNRSVWSKIEKNESVPSISEVLFRWIKLLEVPKFALTAITIATLTGITIGGIQAKISQEDNYMASLKPFNISHQKAK